MAKSVLDVAYILDVMVDPSKTTLPLKGYTSTLSSGLAGLKIGAVDPMPWLLSSFVVKPTEGANEQMVSRRVALMPSTSINEF
jgi:amidase